jgi:hypothetical protein
MLGRAAVSFGTSSSGTRHASRKPVQSLMPAARAYRHRAASQGGAARHGKRDSASAETLGELILELNERERAASDQNDRQMPELLAAGRQTRR